MDLSVTTYWKIRARLLRVPGVANVAIWGERLKDMDVNVRPNRLKAEKVSLDKVMEVTSQALDAGLLQFSPGAVIGTGGFVETPNQRISARAVTPIRTPDDLAQVAVARRNGRELRIGDVANVVYGPQPLIGDAVVNGGPGLLLVVEKLQGANTLEVTKGVEDALKDLRPGLPGVKIDSTIFRPASFVEIAIHNLKTALLIGCLLVILVLIAFLFEWRAAFISLVAIPLSLVAAGVVLTLRGATINTMILAGFAVAVGVVVDDAIIDMENIVRRMRLRAAAGTPEPLMRTILKASLEVRGAIFYATLINVVAVLPVLFVGGLSGAFFRPLALSYALAVLVSMLVALTVTPALSLILLSRGRLRRREPVLVRGLKRGYGGALSLVIRRPGTAYLTVAAVLLMGLFVAPRLGEELFPGFKERDFLMHWITAPGTSIPEERRMVTRASKELRAQPGVRDFGSHIGQAFLGEEIAGANFGENWVSIDPNADYDRDHRAAAPASPSCTRAFTATCRRTSASGSTRSSSARASRSWCASSATISASCAGPPTGSSTRSRTCPASMDSTPRCRPRCPRSTCASSSTSPAATASSRATCAGPPAHWSPARRSATCSSTGCRPTSWSGATRARATA